MKLTKKLEAEILKVYNAYWDSYVNGDLKTYASLLDVEFKFIGSTEAEPLLNKKDSLKFLEATAEQLRGKAEFRNRNIKIETADDLVLITELCDGYILIGSEWNFYSRFRLSSMLKKKKGNWMFIHQHVSMPDAKAKEGESYGLELVRTENIQLRDAVKRRTIELENKNRELEIETSLEKVRAVAMAMYKPEDLPGVGEILFTELRSLGFADLRNTEIIIISDEKETLTSYYYSDYGVTGVVEVDYKSDPKVQRWVNQLKKANDAFAEVIITEKEIKAWRKYREDVGHVPDPKLNKAKEVYYYSYSIGMGGLSISTFKPASHEQIKILERFRNVFNLSYQRYIDIAKAEAQAREAKIEVALERTRTQSMLMQHSDEIMNVSNVFHEQLLLLGIPTEFSYVWLPDETKQEHQFWATWAEERGEAIVYKNKAITYPLDKSEPYTAACFTAWQNKEQVFIEYIAPAEVKNYFSTFEELLCDAKKMRPEFFTDGLYYAEAYMKYGCFGFNIRRLLSEDEKEILRRFTVEFERTYTRFLDLQKAEAQVREAQIEAALERVRSRSMAMHKSDDLHEVIKVVTEQLSGLSLKFNLANFAKIDPDNSWDLWLSTPEQTYPALIHVPYLDHPIFNRITEEVAKGNDFFSHVYSREDANVFFHHFFENTIAKNTPEERKQFVYNSKGFARSLFLTKNIWFSVVKYSDTPFVDDENAIFKRFANVFEQAYTRFLDLQKAEAQAKEAQIELALERVRARTMAMQKSDELREAVLVIYQQLQELDFGSQACNIIIIDKETREEHFWVSGFAQEIFPESYQVPRLNHHYQEDQFTAWRTGVKYAVFEYTGKEKKKFDKIFFTQTDFRNIPEQAKQLMIGLESIKLSTAFTTYGSLQVLGPEPLSEEKATILKRFAKVFEQTYTRFLDLQKAEAQARESQIELGLERVRARAMAMQKSDELSELVDTVFKELTRLDFALTWCIINIIDEPSLSNTVWAANPDIDEAPESYHMKFEDYPFHHAMMKGYKEKKTKHVYVLEGQEKKIYDEYLFNETEFRRVPAAAQAASKAMEKYVVTFSFSNFGGLQTVGDAPLSDASLDILSRFGKVFDLTYTRFNDLKQAEAQTRESQIQLALERVRARTMAMQKSEELRETSHILFEQMKELGEPVEQLTIGVVQEENKVIEISATLHGEILKKIYQHSLDEPFMMSKIYHAWKTHQKTLIVELKGDELNAYNKYRNELTKSEMFPTNLGDEHRRIVYAAFFSKGMLALGANEPRPPESLQLLERFAGVFDQAYIRFIDLKNAEAQARESQIQLALERVRARTMAMQKSDELPEAANLLFQQVQSLGMPAWSAGYCIWNEDKSAITAWMSSEGVLQPPFRAPTTDDALFIQMREEHEKGKTFHVVDMGGKELVKHYNYMRTLPVVGNILDSIIEAGHPLPTYQIMHYAYFSHGLLLFITYEPVTEAHDIFKRFAKVFDQTYTRFLDLQKSEAQARESQIQLALERVRARTMAMQKSDELMETAVVLFDQLKQLGEHIERTIIGVVNEEEGVVDFWATRPDGSQMEKMQKFSIDEPIVMQRVLGAWREQKKSIIIDLQGEELENYFQFMKTRAPRLKRENFGERRVESFAFFSKGILGVISVDPTTPANTGLYERFAAVFDQTYTRFLDLQKAEAQAREARIETALEKVRARTMSMQRSDELADTSALLFRQFSELGYGPDRMSIGIFREEKQVLELWTTGHEAEQTAEFFQASLSEPHVLSKGYQAWKQQSKSFVVELSGEALKEYIEYWKEIGLANYSDAIKDRIIINTAFFSKGYIGFISLERLPQQTIELLERFAGVFDQTYTRFLDLKKAEEQAKEAKIESSLERVRSRAMAMQSSEELNALIGTVFTELTKLDLVLTRSVILIFDPVTKGARWWMANSEAPSTPMNFFVKHHDLPFFNSYLKGWKERTIQWQYILEGNDKIVTDDVLFNKTGLSELPDYVIVGMKANDRVFLSASFNNFGCLNLASLEPLSDEHFNILLRFAKVFDLTYTRFNDLKQAEAQAKEAKIEAALERVRSRSMAMHSPEELKDVALELRNQLGLLEQPELEVCAIHLYEESPDYFEAWGAVRPPGDEGKIIQVQVQFPKKGIKIVNEMFRQYESGAQDYILVNEGEKHPEWLNVLKECVPEGYEMVIQSLKGRRPEDTPAYWSMADFSGGSLVMTTYIPPGDDARKLLRRFANVFGLAYRRFIDLKNAELQKREAQIELALERVRARTMAMHRSEELAEAAAVLFQQFVELGNEPDRFSIGIIDDETNTTDVWATDQAGSEINVRFRCDNYANPTMARMTDGWKAKESSLVIDLQGEELKNWLNYVRHVLNMPVSEEQVYGRRLHHLSFFAQGWLNFTTHEPLTADAKSLLDRFASVFNLTFRRFLDLQKAEAQANEARIEIALERIRARALAMHKSDELFEVTKVMREQMALLGQPELEASVVHLYEQDVDHILSWRAFRPTESHSKIAYGHMSIPKNSCGFVKEWLNKFYGESKEYTIELSGARQEEWYDVMTRLAPDVVNAMRQDGSIHEKRYYRFSKFSGGALLMVSKQEPSVEVAYLQSRAAVVFDLAYRRFSDLQKAEAQAREAQIEAALERVRSKTMAMHNSNDLLGLTNTLSEQFIQLGFEKDETVSFITDSDEHGYNIWLANPGESFLKKFYVPRLQDKTTKLWREAIEQGKNFYTYILTKEEKDVFFQNFFENTELKIYPDEGKQLIYDTPGLATTVVLLDKITLSKSNFRAMPYTDEQNAIIKRFAFVFQQSYTRFLDLKKAESQAREAQIEASLERIRSRAMAMHKTNELLDAGELVYKELSALGINNMNISYAFVDEEEKYASYYSVNPVDGRIPPFPFVFPHTETEVMRSLLSSWKKQEPFGVIELDEAASIKHQTYIGEHIYGLIKKNKIDIPFSVEAFLEISPKTAVIYSFNFKQGYLFIIGEERLTTEQEQIALRFVKVFELAYRRFLDLTQAEAQAREAQIETALEKVRSRSLAMHKSDELQEVITTVFDRFQELNIEAATASILITNVDTGVTESWIQNAERTYTAAVHIPSFEQSIISRDFKAALTNRIDLLSKRYSKEDKNIWFSFLFDTTELGKIPEERKQYVLDGECYYVSTVVTKNGGIYVGRYVDKPFTQEENTILKRFAKVFEQAYIRFLDLQKAEAQAKEAQIEAALEKVRSRSLAMHKSDELQEVVNTLFERLQELDVEMDSANIAIFKEGKRDFEFWIASPAQKKSASFHIADWDFAIIQGVINARANGQDFFSRCFSYEEKNDWFTYAFENTDFKRISDERRKYILESKAYALSIAYSKNTGVQINNYSGKLPSESETEILKRFSKVFEQAYIRFLDLEKAEAQARESQIEASLERVRSKTMAMHNSQDVADTVATMFDELVKLGIQTLRCGVGILHEGYQMELWTAKPNETGKIELFVGHLDMTLHPLLKSGYESWKEKREGHSYELKDDDLIAYFNVINNNAGYQAKYDIDSLPSCIFHDKFNFNEGFLFSFSLDQLSAESSQIFKRFAGVFGQTYRRYLDLQKAEAQAREAQIEAGLERVRARTMAMHNSEDVSIATATMFTELEKLGIENLRGGITIISPDQTQEVWSITNMANGKIIRAVGVFDMRLHPLWQDLFKGKENKEDYKYYWLAGKDKEAYITILNSAPNYLSQPIKEFPDVHVQSYFFGEGGVWTNSLQPHSEEDKQVMKRFASVFSLTFRRYQDLKKAEAQAREATIEASLERVRGKAMAMHSSKDLATTIGVFYHELESLSLTPRRCGVGLIDKETRMAEISTMNATADGHGVELVGNLDLRSHPVLTGVYNNWLTKTEYHPVLRGHEIKEYYQLVRPQINFPDYPNDTVQYGYFFFFEEGGVYAWTEKELNEDELKIYRRFTSVLSLTYKRYKDLKDAEARTQTAIKDAALDRIRADIASMRTISDLDRITPLIWNELTVLGIPFIRCGVFIMDEDQQLIHTFLSTPDGKAIAAFHLPYDTPGNLSHVIANWKVNRNYIDRWAESEFKQFADILVKQGTLASAEQYLKTIPKGGFYLHFLPFLQGMLYVGNTAQLHQEEIELIQHVADAFSTAYARYEDFNKLEAAKQQVENTLTDLKQAQQQLVQSEKMASLGELTAGIAHEIQNPLNFVNNFSDVSNELLEEMKTELEKGNKEDAIAIVEDVKQNLEKILHHGKRADAIVKGMLQHSRTSSGQKEPTDINILADEYLRLAFHGLRAKDKSFNAKFETEFDNSIGKVNMIPQDIGRVILNLINNAFYAVTEKKKVNTNGYEPTVTVTTKRDNGKIEIRVKDNGNGISQKVLDKIFQPFFTTKPTGQGTGLGLSLAYDIVTKGHGGELKVETKEGEGSEFSIQLPG